jgi:hypothetical protein
LTIVWSSSSTRPKPNSIAENTKKKKVNERMFRLLKVTPIKRAIAYNVIQSNSAIKSKFRELLLFSSKFKNIKIK